MCALIVACVYYFFLHLIKHIDSIVIPCSAREIKSLPGVFLVPYMYDSLFILLINLLVFSCLGMAVMMRYNGVNQFRNICVAHTLLSGMITF